jgi:thymidylate kinase
MSGRGVMVCVSGADGSGKSSLVSRLAGAMPNARVVTIWDLMADPAARPLFADKAALQTFLGTLLPESRSLFLMSCLKAAMERASTGLRVVDAYWYKYLANEVALGADPERVLPLGKMFERPALTLHLELAPEVAAERKKGGFTPYECGLKRPGAEAFIAFQTRTAPLVKKLVDGDAREVVHLDGTRSPDALFEEALARLREVAS